MKFGKTALLTIVIYGLFAFPATSYHRYLTIRHIEGFILRDFVINSTISGTLGMLIIAILWFFLARWLAGKVTNVTERIKQINQGNLNVQLSESNIYEIGKLTAALNRTRSSFKLAIMKTSKIRQIGSKEIMKRVGESITPVKPPKFAFFMKIKTLMVSMYLLTATVLFIPATYFRYVKINFLAGFIFKDFMIATAYNYIGLMIVTFIVTYTVSSLLSKPLEKVTDKIDEVTKGNFTVELGTTKVDEIRELTSELNNMIRKLEQAVIKARIKSKKI